MTSPPSNRRRPRRRAECAVVGAVADHHECPEHVDLNADSADHLDVESSRHGRAGSHVGAGDARRTSPRNLATDGGVFGGWRDFLDAFPDAACVVDHLGRIVFANRRLHEMTSYPAGALDGRPVEILVPEEQRVGHRRDVRRYIGDPSPRTMGAGRRTACRRTDGSSFAADIALAPLAHDGGAWTIAILRDDSERQRTEQELFRQATHDDLTGLANRGLLDDRLERIGRRRPSRRKPLTVLFLDLDRFKAVNDADGHAAGDDVLRVVARALEATFRPSDTIARVGGDEFVVVCDETTEAEATALASRALEAVRLAVKELPHRSAAGVTASVGVVSAVAKEDARSVLARADAAMYAAKRRGGNQILVV